MVRAVRIWLGRLATELDRSPLAQLMFVLGLAGAVFGVITAWSSILEVIARSWLAMILAVGTTTAATVAIRRYRANQSTETRGTRLEEALDRLRQLGSSVTETDARNLLWQRFGADADQIIDDLKQSNLIKVDYKDHVIVCGAKDD